MRPTKQMTEYADKKIATKLNEIKYKLFQVYKFELINTLGKKEREFKYINSKEDLNHFNEKYNDIFYKIFTFYRDLLNDLNFDSQYKLYDLIRELEDTEHYKCPLDEGENVFPCHNVLKYRGREFPIYTDDYGSQDFIMVHDKSVAIDTMGGTFDWDYEIDRIMDLEPLLDTDTAEKCHQALERLFRDPWYENIV